MKGTLRSFSCRDSPSRNGAITDSGGPPVSISSAAVAKQKRGKLERRVGVVELAPRFFVAGEIQRHEQVFELERLARFFECGHARAHPRDVLGVVVREGNTRERAMRPNL